MATSRQWTGIGEGAVVAVAVAATLAVCDAGACRGEQPAAVPAEPARDASTVASPRPVTGPPEEKPPPPPPVPAAPPREPVPEWCERAALLRDSARVEAEDVAARVGATTSRPDKRTVVVRLGDASVRIRGSRRFPDANDRDWPIATTNDVMLSDPDGRENSGFVSALKSGVYVRPRCLFEALGVDQTAEIEPAGAVADTRVPAHPVLPSGGGADHVPSPTNGALPAGWVATSPDGQKLVALVDGTPVVLDRQTGWIVARLQAVDNPRDAKAVGWLADSCHVAMVWHFADGGARSVVAISRLDGIPVQIGHTRGWPHRVTSGPDGTTVVFGDMDPRTPRVPAALPFKPGDLQRRQRHEPKCRAIDRVAPPRGK